MRKLSLKRQQHLNKWSQRIESVRRVHPSVSKRPQAAPKSHKIWAPREFDLIETDDRHHTLKFLQELRQKMLRIRGAEIVIDFSRTVKLHAAGTLLFSAELRRMLRHTGGEVRLRCVLPENEKVSQVFEQVGIYKLFGVSGVISPVDDDVVHWRFAHGHKVEGERYEDVLAEYDGDISEELQESLFKGMTEAMTNVINHAYLLPREDGCAVEDRKEWWMFSHFRNEKIGVVFCDLGAGIPRTLPLRRKELWARLLRFGRTTDHSAIENAVKDSISRTGLSHRGKGLGQIFSTVRAVEGAEVVVFSNFGVFARTKTGGTVRKAYGDSIMGTLIHWTIPLQLKEQS